MSKKIIITRDIEGNEAVEKIVSLNPDKYEWKDFYKMLDDYAYYCNNIEAGSYYKPFFDWLLTEI